MRIFVMQERKKIPSIKPNCISKRSVEKSIDLLLFFWHYYSMDMKESDLYPPLRDYLVGQGYQVAAEVKQCDVAARKDGRLIIVELKKKAGLRLLAQAVRRKRYCDSVYVALADDRRGGKKGLRRREIATLLRELEIGLIVVVFLKTKTRIEVCHHPAPLTVRRMPARRRAIIGEINGRYAEFNSGGEATKIEKITAYKQRALLLSHLLAQGGADGSRLWELKKNFSNADTCSQILSRNNYGWFERISRGCYRLSAAGKNALIHYQNEIGAIVNSIKQE